MRPFWPSSASGVDQIALAGLIACDRTTITGAVDRLERKGLATRVVNDTDRLSAYRCPGSRAL